jgi:hypothetical protein
MPRKAMAAAETPSLTVVRHHKPAASPPSARAKGSSRSLTEEGRPTIFSCSCKLNGSRRFRACARSSEERHMGKNRRGKDICCLLSQEDCKSSRREGRTRYLFMTKRPPHRKVSFGRSSDTSALAAPLHSVPGHRCQYVHRAQKVQTAAETSSCIFEHANNPHSSKTTEGTDSDTRHHR